MIIITKTNLVWAKYLKNEHFEIIELVNDFEAAKTQIFEREYDTRLAFIDASDVFNVHKNEIILRFGLIYLHCVHKIFLGETPSRASYFRDEKVMISTSIFSQCVKNYRTHFGNFRIHSYNQMKLVNDLVRKVALNDILLNKKTPILFGSEIESIPSTYGIDVVHIGKPTFRNAILADTTVQYDYADFYEPKKPDPYTITPRKLFSRGPHDDFNYASKVKKESLTTNHVSIANSFNALLDDISNSQRKLLHLFLAQLAPNSTHLYIGAYPGTATISFIKLLPDMNIDFFFYDPMFQESSSHNYGNRLHIINKIFTAEDVSSFISTAPLHPNFVFTSDIRMDALETMEENDKQTYDTYDLQFTILNLIYLYLIERNTTTIFYSSLKGIFPDWPYKRIVGSVEVLQPSYRYDDDGLLRANETRIFFNTIVTGKSSPLVCVDGNSREDFLQQYSTSIPEQHILQDFLSAGKIIYANYLLLDYEIDIPHEFIVLNTITNIQNDYSDVVKFINDNKEKINTINFYGRDIFAPEKYRYHGFLDHTIDSSTIIDFLEYNSSHSALNHLQLSPLFGLPVHGLYSSKLFTVCKGFERLTNYSIGVQDLVTSPAQGNLSLKLKSNMLIPEFSHIYQDEKLKSVSRFKRLYLYAEGSSGLFSEFFDPSGHLALLMYGRNNPQPFYTLRTYHVNAEMNINKIHGKVTKGRKTKNRFLRSQRYLKRGGFTNVELENVVWHGSDEVRAGLQNGYNVRKYLGKDVPGDFELMVRLTNFYNSQVISNYDGFKVYGLRNSSK